MDGYGYGRTAAGAEVVDEMRTEEFPHMQGQVYLDHAGATIYSARQLAAHQKLLLSNLFGNPHSTAAPSGGAAAAALDAFRHQLAAFFHTTLETYDIIFTSGATGGLKLIGETFPFSDHSAFVYSADSHNSVVGLRSFAHAAGAAIIALPPAALDNLRSSTNTRLAPLSGDADAETLHLCAFPGECNFSGAKHDLSVVHAIQTSGLDEVASSVEEHTIAASRAPRKRGRWLVLLDAAKLAATNPVDLSMHTPDFMVLSFYKLFGYPTGTGALFVKKSAQRFLRKTYFGGGTLATSLASALLTKPRDDFDRRFSDGTASFLSLLACQAGLDQLQRLGMCAIQRHTAALTKHLATKLSALRHGNDQRLCDIYGDHHLGKHPGSVVALNVRRADGSVVGYTEVSALAALHNIHLRTGCFCNPGACQMHLNLSANDLLSHMELGHTCGDAMDVIDGRPTGAVRVSVGYMTTRADVDKFLDFIATYFVARAVAPAPVVPPPMPQKLYLAKITLFPIKSCAGLSVPEWPLAPRGLLYDREWAVVDPTSGKALRQKDAPVMTQIRPRIDLDSHVLVVQCGDLAPLRLPLTYVPPTSQTLTVCATACRGSAYDGAVAAWFSAAVGRPCTLVRVPVDGDEGFANEAPFLLLSRASVAAMNCRLPTPVSEDVFRANLIVDGCAPHDEDSWRRVDVGSEAFDVLGPCPRCSMVNIDPTTGAFSPAPLQTLAGYRRDKARIFFGQFLRQSAPGRRATMVRVGDVVVGNL
ncbi:molybdenum cofactor sulfurase [Achlya hypogyna]|uniref:Molybdenum cofactor sulfurase n=1 Tax=Achlya hypogyna TaxID=1202772 RepID=A0A1V9ZM48_ACHHY|nr:molybdenum cofactor sulfurase [Achlya hypogyna]